MSRNNLPFLVVLGALAGCASSLDPGQGGNPPGSDASTPTPDSGTPGPGVDSGPGGNTFDAHPNPGPDTSTPVPAIPLPFYLSDQFVPTGFMGDSQPSMAALTLAHDATTCKSPRSPGAGGDCFTAKWAPTLADGGAAWAGVYWQSPPNNWGTKPGKAIAAGATKVSFYAAGAVGGEIITVSVGGINNTTTAAAPFGDTFSIKLPSITLTPAWKQYEIPLTGATYSAVLGGFCWVVAATGTESITFYVDDIKWE